MIYKVPVIIVARYNSSRLRGKILRKVGPYTMLELLINRISESSYIGKIVVATSTHEGDNHIEEYCSKIGISCFRGSEDNVLERVYQAAKHYQFNSFLKILGDNPFMEAPVIDKVIQIFKEKELDYCATLTNEYKGIEGAKFPIGTRVQAYSMDIFEQAHNHVVSDYNKEHSSTYFVEHLSTIKHEFLKANNEFKSLDRPTYNFAVNTQFNLDLINQIHNEMNNDYRYSLKDVINHVDNHPPMLELMGNGRG